MTTLIAITGKAGHGKDTLAKLLGAYGFRRRAFADRLKEAAAVIVGEPVENFHDVALKDAPCPALGGVSRRKLMQGLGTGVREYVSSHAWLLPVLDEWLCDGSPDTVISDLRLDNEAAAILQLDNTVIVSVERPGVEPLPGDHVSEAGIHPSYIDYMFVNDGSIEDLERQVEKFVGWLSTFVEARRAG